MVEDMYLDLCSLGFSDSWFLGCVGTQICRSISSQELFSARLSNISQKINRQLEPHWTERLQ
jgi:hypothetical protein